MRNELIAEVAFLLFAAVANPDSIPMTSAPPPTSRELSEIQARFTFRGEARLSRQGTRSILSHPQFGFGGIDYGEVIGEDGWPAAQSLPRPISWTEVDTLWRRNSRAGIGAVIGAVVLSLPAGAWGHDRWPSREDTFLTVATTALGATAGGILGATVGSAWFTWERVRPAPTPSRGHGPSP
jgi:hypothetical protein